jgi:hypothetical protein
VLWSKSDRCTEETRDRDAAAEGPRASAPVTTRASGSERRSPDSGWPQVAMVHIIMGMPLHIIMHGIPIFIIEFI